MTTPFDDDAISPKVAKFVAELEATLAELPAAHEVPVEVSRKARDEGKGIFPFNPPDPDAEEIEIPTDTGGSGILRLMRPTGTPTGVFLHIHGGGWTLGRPWHQDFRMRKFVEATGCATVSVEYRLAPENPWPAGAKDCANAAEWVIDNMAEVFGTTKLAIGGESAGANLAATTLLAMKDRGKLVAFDGALMIYGAYDLSGTPSVRNWGPRKLVLSTPTINWFTANLDIPHNKQRDPMASPLYGDLAGMPPALFQCGTYDPLMDDTAFMASRWQAAGSAQDTIWYPRGGPRLRLFQHLSGR